ncbi:hypothetical protein L1987_24548 [Smallanthus sonchifolius]|uniref:Uncharacterized protein n=1 Tax=Smallanthus sonchifolius TaxID=185202 RepID=A0ACB9IM30_9ASTR|nr:hypothetical protein L1987_24548 [Smallanthus sonchifolius]
MIEAATVEKTIDIGWIQELLWIRNTLKRRHKRRIHHELCKRRKTEPPDLQIVFPATMGMGQKRAPPQKPASHPPSANQPSLEKCVVVDETGLGAIVIGFGDARISPEHGDLYRQGQ